MSDWILVPYDDDKFETWVRASCVERIYVDKTPDSSYARCRLHLMSKEKIDFHFKDIAAIANACGIGYYGGVPLPTKANEPDPAKFKPGDHVYVVGGEVGDWIVNGGTLCNLILSTPRRWHFTPDSKGDETTTRTFATCVASELDIYHSECEALDDALRRFTFERNVNCERARPLRERWEKSNG